MKVRQDQVTNSSSVSYVCVICGNHEGGSDCIGMKDWGFARCQCGHTMCLHHVPEFENPYLSMSDEELLKYMEENNKWYFNLYQKEADEKEKARMLKNFRKDQDEGEVPEKFCPICNLSIITAQNSIDYARAQGYLNLEKLEEEIRDKFSNVKELDKFVKTGQME